MLLLFKPYKKRLAFSLLLVSLESIGWILFPFVIGIAINDFLNGEYNGLILFCLLGLATLILMSFRRFHDTRHFTRIYKDIGLTSIKQNSKLSQKTARLNMLSEIVEFFEHSMPQLINSFAVLFGSLFFLAFLNTSVFWASLLVSLLIVFIYGLSSKKTVFYNHKFNNEYEKQVDILNSKKPEKIQTHLLNLNAWTIKLSDIETINFGLTWILVILLQLYAIVTSANQLTAYGTILSVVLYVFEFTETSIKIPYSWQEYLRLRDILNRVKTS